MARLRFNLGLSRGKDNPAIETQTVFQRLANSTTQDTSLSYQYHVELWAVYCIDVLVDLDFV